VPPESGVAWLRVALGSAYDLGQWFSSRPPRPPRFADIRYGSAVAPADRPLPIRDEDGAWTDALFRYLQHERCPGEWRWDLAPVPASGETVVPSAREWERVPGDGRFRARSPSASERLIDDRREARRRAVGWSVRLTVGSGSVADADRWASVLRRLSRWEGENALKLVRPGRLVHRTPPAMWFTEAEIATLFPPPWAPFLDVREDAAPARRSGLSLGTNGVGENVVLPADPAEGRHVLILGETGMGKSSALVRLSRAAIERGSVVWFDPVGDVAREFLAGLPDAAVPRTTWISPRDSPVALNALAPMAGSDASPELRERGLRDLVAALRRVRLARYPETSFWGPRLEDVVMRALSAVARRDPRATLVDAERLLDPRAGRAAESRMDEEIRSLRELARERPEEVEGARRLLGEVVRDPVLVRLLCEPSPTWSPAEALRPSRVTVVAGDAPAVGESTARYLLSVHLALLWSAILSRPTRTKVFVVLDEAHLYAHESLAEMLRLARRFNVHIWTATQALHALPLAWRDAVLTNSSDYLLFRGSPDEAREFARWTPDLTAERLLSLRRGQAAVLIGKGERVEWAELPAPRRRRSHLEPRVGRFRPPPEAPPAEPGPPAATGAEVRPASRVAGADGAAKPDALEEDVAEAQALVDEALARLGVTDVALPVSMLRAHFRPEVVRRLGSELARQGRLESVETPEDGRTWRLRPPAGPSEVRPGDPTREPRRTSVVAALVAAMRARTQG
jgi:hypothetical protein